MLMSRVSFAPWRPVCVLLGLWIGSTQAGEYYKWVDDKGVTHFSEKPVPGASAKKVGTATKYTDSPSSEAAEQNANPDEATAGNKPAENPQDAENCKIAQERLRSLQSGQRIRLVGADGKFTYLDENQVKDEIVKTQAVIKNSCR